MDLWHVTLAAEGRPTLWPDAHRRLLAARTVVRAGAGRLLLFCLVDDHAHLVVEGDRDAAGHRVSSIVQALKKGHQIPLDPARLRPVNGSDHLSSLVTYIGNQPVKHGIHEAEHPATWEAGCVMDLLGARRWLGFDARRLYAHLPRLAPRQVADRFGLPPLQLADDEQIWRMGAPAWIDAVRVGFGLVNWVGRGDRVVAARHVAIVVGRRCFGPEGLAQLVGVGDRATRRMRANDPALERAPRRQLWLRAFLHRCATPAAVMQHGADPLSVGRAW